MIRGEAALENAMSVDLEDWFCAYNMSSVVPRSVWATTELRVVQNTERLLAMFDRRGMKATFFVLGWIADRVPELVREIERRGHEIAAHGYEHLLVTQISRRVFEDDLVKSLKALERCGVRNSILGFRAPSFTIVERTRWALEVLAAHGIRYDSSVFPVSFHPDYGVPDSPLAPYQITPDIVEFPMGVVRVLGRNLPFSGGGYLRLVPYSYTRACLRRANREGRPVVFYIHPWEIDAGQPRMPISLPKRLRHYTGLKTTEAKMDRLLTDFRFTTIKKVLGL
jgi:polysaccharide deacetylase family protein (PEP-CTERM system associated)